MDHRRVLSDEPGSAPGAAARPAAELLANFPLFRALLDRRSRRFGLGMRLDGGPLAFASKRAPVPLGVEEEAALVFAGSGATGSTYGELPFRGDRPESGGGQILAGFLGRTIPSADAIQAVSLVVIDDEGAFYVRRPADLPKAEIPALVALGREGKFLDAYLRLRRPIARGRPDVPRRNPFVPPFNLWSANVAGTSYFIPIDDITPLYLNVLLSALSEEFGYMVVDERAGFRPAGLGAFARSRGGHLEDDPRAGRTVTIEYLETWIVELVALEQGMMVQSLALAAEAMGLGGFPHFAAHPFGWFRALGFRMQEMPASRALGMGPVLRAAARLLGRDVPVPLPVGLERDGEVLLRALAPPYFPDMGAAVRALLDTKYGPAGAFRDGGATTAFRDPASVQAGIPEYSARTVEAAIACAEYIRTRYGRFPAYTAPFRTGIAFQAHHLDLEFYDRFYRPGAYTEAHRRHFEIWHGDGAPAARP